VTSVESYRDGTALRTALERRLLNTAHGKDQAWLVRSRKLLAFERLLARLLVVAPDRWTLIGAVALDFRLGDRARATIDLDLLRLEGEDAAAEDLQAAQTKDLGDCFVFHVERTNRLDNLIDGSAVRCKVRADLDGRRFEFVTLDVDFDQEIVAPPDLLTGPDFLAFAGIPPVVVPTIPLEQHVA
jgi:hypothetical protein